MSNPKKTGIELIAIERKEQIRKHGRTLESDVKINKKGELTWAANMLLRTRGQFSVFHMLSTTRLKNWDQKILKRMDKKPYKERLIIAGALIAAEIDRLQNSES